MQGLKTQERPRYLSIIESMNDITTASEQWAELITTWTTRLRAAGYPETTIELRTYQLRRLAKGTDLDPHTITTDDIITWLGNRNWANSTRRSHRAAFLTFFTWMHATGRRPDNPATDLDPVPSPDPNPKPASELAIRNALHAATPLEYLAIRLASERGLRRGEIVQIHHTDLYQDFVGWSLTVHGKGAKIRITPLSDSLAELLHAACTAGGGYAFPGRHRGHLTPGSLGKHISDLLPEGTTMHSLRHRFATTTYLRTHDLIAVQKLLGHARPETTLLYIKMPDDHLRAIAATADPAAA